MLLATSMAPPLCGEAAVSLAFVLAAMPDHLYIKSRSLSARYTPIRSRGFMIPSVFSQFPAPAYRHARHGAGQGWHQLQSHRWPKPREPLGWLWHGGGTAPCPSGWAVGSRVTPAQHRASPGPGHLTREGIYRTLREAEPSLKERGLSLRESWLESGGAGDAPTAAQLGMHLVFPRVTWGETLCGILCCTCRHHTSEITGKIKTWKTIKRELPGKRIRIIWCLYEASVELQQARKEGLSGMSEWYTFSHYTPNFCLWTHCYSISEIFALAVLVLVLSDTKPLSLLLQWNYFLS